MLRSGLSLRFQPIVDAATGRVVAAEALLREDDSVIAPYRLLTDAVQNGQSEALDRDVLEAACAQLRTWHAAGVHLPVHVNVTASTAVEVDPIRFARWLRRLMTSNGAVTIEITETTRIRGFRAMAAFAEACRDAGIEVAIDDFGCGYATLALLQRFRADVVKIDRRFVHAIVADVWTQSIVRHMIALAHDLGIRVIGEGVESAEQAACLRGVGCDELQGYAIARPMTSGDFVRWVLQRGGEANAAC